MQNCMFQYATNRSVIHDTGLISIDEALKLFNENKERFKEDLKKGAEPEMALWINCKDDSSYGEALHHWSSDDFMFHDGFLWSRV